MQMYISHRLSYGMLIKLFSFSLLFWFTQHLAAQQTADSVKTDGYVVFKYPGGQKSSEGTMKGGKPDGYWKTYFENGRIKSEGNRLNFELDSIWKFYDDSSRLQLTIEYKHDRKNGLKTTYKADETVAENFIDDVKQENTTYYYPDGKVHMVIPFVNGLEQGI